MTGERAETEVTAGLLARGFNRHIKDHGPDGDFAGEPMESGDGHGLLVRRGGVAYSVRVEYTRVPATPGRMTPGQAWAALKEYIAGLAGQGPAGAEPDAYVLTISHRGGDGTTLHPSEEAARAELADFVCLCWDEIQDYEGRATPGVTGPPPDDDEEAIRLYFEHQDDESYDITPAALPRPGEREAIMARMQELEGS